MKIKELTQSASRAFHKAGFQLKKHSPEILVVGGVIGGVVSAVLACKATTKVSAVIEQAKVNVDTIHEYAENPEMAEQYSKEDAQKDLVIVYAQTGLQIAKLYAPAVLLGTASALSILKGHNILRKRNLALAAAYTAVDKGFKGYRSRVVERFGDKLDKELLYNIKTKEVEETVVDENGNETVVTKTIEVTEPGAVLSPYTWCFDETSTCWKRDAERNKFFLAQQQDWANERLKSRGFVFLNEVLDMLGFQHCRMGQTVGWMLDGDGDGYIDFGCLNIHNEASRNFMNGLEKSIWLNFNVDGDITHHFKER